MRIRSLLIAALISFASPALAEDSRTVADMFPGAAICTAPTAAQKAQWLGDGQPIPGYEQFRKYFSPTPDYSQYANPVPAPEEKRFGWWGYKHKWLHDHNVVAELLEKSKPTNCCSGVSHGECRVTKFVTDILTNRKKVLIDDLECDVSEKTKIVELESYEDQETVVVCAGKTASNNGYPRSCPTTYCIGSRGGT